LTSKRIVRSLSVAALVVLALAVPAFAQEDLPCRNANEDETVRCNGKLYDLVDDNVVDDNDSYGSDEYPWWDYGDGSYDYPPLWGYPDESYDDPPYYDYPPLGGYDNESYYDEEDYEEAYEEAQEQLKEYYEEAYEQAQEELQEAYG
jgi:hypothetical protein